MDAWAVKYKGRATFVCVCCAGHQLAEEFGNQLRLKNCVNSWVDRQNMPFWGQLGCNGFILFDKNLKVLKAKTSAFLEVRDQAFREVETILSRVLAPPPRKHISVPSISAVQSMSVKQLKALITSLSGSFSDCVEKADLIRRAMQLVEKARPASDSPAPKRRKRQGVTEARPPVPATTSTDAVSPMGEIKSVKVKVLDDEHEECMKALAAMVERKDYDSLMAVIRVYESHFKHEEELLDKHLYAAASTTGGSFNADAGVRRSHYSDHGRLIAELHEATCASKRGVPLSKTFLERTLRNFEDHANRYDATYAARLSAAMK